MLLLESDLAVSFLSLEPIINHTTTPMIAQSPTAPPAISAIIPPLPPLLAFFLPAFLAGRSSSSSSSSSSSLRRLEEDLLDFESEGFEDFEGLLFTSSSRGAATLAEAGRATGASFAVGAATAAGTLSCVLHDVQRIVFPPRDSGTSNAA